MTRISLDCVENMPNQMDSALMQALYGNQPLRPFNVLGDPMQPLLEHHNANVEGGGTTFNSPTGSESSLKTRIVPAPGGGFWVIPTIWGGKELSAGESYRKALQSGKKWPQFNDPDQADTADSDFHQRYWGNGWR